MGSGRHQLELDELRLDCGKRAKELSKRIKRGQRRFVITSCQNNTKIDVRFFDALQVYCRERGTELIVAPILYKNVSAYAPGESVKPYWDLRVHPFLIDKRMYLGGGISLMADINIQATALNPLEGKAAIGGKRSSIFAHPQIAMQPVATPSKKPPKLMYTTGAVSLKNYSRTNAGAKAEFHHSAGALIVEVEGSKAFVRQLLWDGKGFYDLDQYYTPAGSEQGQTATVLTLGDEHVKFHSRDIRDATFDARDSITNLLRPEFLVRHDILDGYAGSHHHRGMDLINFKKWLHKEDDYRAELEQAADFLNDTTPPWATSLIVPSNHHDHLSKWLDKADPKREHINAILYYELKLAQLNNLRAGKGPLDPFEIFMSDKLSCKFKFLDRNSPYLIGAVDYSQHGDVGINGSRGSAKALANAVSKMVIGHSHSASICRGVYCVGVSTGPLEYQRGLSTWTNSHCVQYANGKRTLVTIRGRKWRGSY